MSYTSLVIFRDGKPDSEIEFRNANRGAWLIWDSLYRRYVDDSESSYALKDDGAKLWPLADDPRLDDFERRVHLFTCDMALVGAVDFERFSVDLHRFAERHDLMESSHLPEWAGAFWGAANKSDGSIDAIGLYPTSVTDNPWWYYPDGDREKESEPYNLRFLTRHFYVYEYGGEVAC